MNFISMRPQPLLAHWVPGLTFTIILMLGLQPGSRTVFVAAAKPYGGTASVLFCLAVFSFVIGQVFDSVRDIFEMSIERLGYRKVDWSFFAKAEDRHIANTEQWFFTYYILNFNLAFALLVLAVMPWVSSLLVLASWLRWLFVVLAAIFFVDAWSLRDDVADITEELMP